MMLDILNFHQILLHPPHYRDGNGGYISDFCTSDWMSMENPKLCIRDNTMSLVAPRIIE